LGILDTFFFLSGFLAAWGILQQLSKKSLSVHSYLLLMFARFVRLTPSYMLVVFFNWKVQPYLATGPNWAAFALGNNACDDRWYLNMFYVNNLFPW